MTIPMIYCLAFRPLRDLGAFLVVIATALSIHGELPPSVYKDLQEKSPEALMIKVESVRISTTDEPTLERSDITAEVRVETVIHSVSGLKPGDVIRISYLHLDHKRPLAGPSEPDILQKGRSYPAFLAKAGKDDVYTTAARGYSFRTAN